MTESAETLPPLTRREMVTAPLVIAGVASAPFWVPSLVNTAETGRATDRQRRVLAIVSDIVLPATATPGAAATDAGAFVETALNHGLDGTRDPSAAVAIAGAYEQPFHLAGLRLLREVEALLDARTGGDFLAASRDRRTAAVAAIDAQAFAPGGEAHPWHKLKDLILTGYYTSEIGGAQELAYTLVPGRWDPDVPLADQPRAYSSDWTAVDFG